MYLSSYYLEELQLKLADVQHLPENEQKQKIRLQWMHLCLNTDLEQDIDKYNRAYHQLISPYDFPSSNIGKYCATSMQLLMPDSFCYFNLQQREEIEKSYQLLLIEFEKLATEPEKLAFVQQHRDFINLAKSLRSQRKEFEKFGGGYLYVIRKKFTLSVHITYQWRLLMIRLFGIEGLDDFQYRHALSTGNLNPILARDKLFSPIKLLVALVNSIITIITVTLNYILNTHFLIKLAFSFLLFHPVAIILVQLSRIAKILEMLACAKNQIIRPLSIYTQCSEQVITATLGAITLITAHACIYTSLLTSLIFLLPYIQLLLLARVLFSLAKLTVPHFQQSFADGLVFSIVFALTFAAITGIKMYIANSLNIGTLSSNTQFKSWMRMMSLFSLTTVLLPNQQSCEDVQMLPHAHHLAPDAIQATVRTRCNKANLSHRFFNTPKEADAIRLEEANQHSFCFRWS